MAEPSILDAFQSFFRAGDQSDPRVNQQLRQRIALQMMSNRKGYPKTLGEGLSAIGDAIGDRGLQKMMEQQDLAAQTAALRGPGPAQSSSAAPQRTSDASTDNYEQPTRPVVADASPDASDQSDTSTAAAPLTAQPSFFPDPASAVAAAAPQPEPYRPPINAIRPPQAIAPWLDRTVQQYFAPQSNAAPQGNTGAAGDYSYPPTASVAGDTMSDAAPQGVSGISPRVGAGAGQSYRDLIAQRPPDQLFPAPGVPQPNPTAGALPPTGAPSPLAPVPGGADQRLASLGTATDIRPAPPQQPIRPMPTQLAQASQQPQAIPGYVPPVPGPVPGAPIAQPTQRELDLQRWVAANQGNSYVAQSPAAAELARLVNERAIRQNENNERFKAGITERTKLLEMHEQGRMDQAKRIQDIKEQQQKLIDGGPQTAAPIDPRLLGTPQSPQRSGIPAVPPVPAGVSPQQWAEKQAPEMVKAVAAYEKAVPQFDEAIKTLKLAQEHPGREWGVGAMSDYAKKIPGTSAYGFGKIMEQIGGKNFLNAYQQLKGGGSITEIEGTKAEAAQARLATAQNKQDFDKAMVDFENALRQDLETVQRKVNRPVTAWRATTDNASTAPDIGQRRGNKEYVGGNPADPMSWRPVQ